MSKSTDARVVTVQWLSCVIGKTWTQSSKRLSAMRNCVPTKPLHFRSTSPSTILSHNSRAVGMPSRKSHMLRSPKLVILSQLFLSCRTFLTVRPQTTSSTLCLKFSKSCCSTVHRRSHFEVVLEAIGASLWLHLVLGQVRLLLGSELTRSALVQIGLITTACILPFVGGG